MRRALYCKVCNVIVPKSHRKKVHPNELVVIAERWEPRLPVKQQQLQQKQQLVMIGKSSFAAKKRQDKRKCRHCGKIFADPSLLQYHTKIFHEHMTRVFICSVCKARVKNGTLHKREMHKNETVSFSMFWQSKKYFPRLAKSGKPYPSLPTTTLLAYHADSEKKKVSITSDPPINEFTNTVADKATDGPGASIQPSDNHRATSSIDKKAVFCAFANKKRQCLKSGLHKITTEKDNDEEIASENDRDRKRSAENSLERPFQKR